MLNIRLQDHDSTNLTANQSNVRNIVKRTPTPPRSSNFINSSNKIPPTSNINDISFRQNLSNINSILFMQI